VTKRATLILLLAVGCAGLARPVPGAGGGAGAGGELRDIRGMLAPEFQPSPLTLVLAAAAAGAGGFAWLRRARRRASPAADGRLGEALAQRLEELTRIFRAGEVGFGHVCTEAAELVRLALEGRTGLRASRLTTEEILHDAVTTGLLPAGPAAAAGTVLRQGDRVKFARQVPNSADTAEVLERTTALLRWAGGNGSP